MLQSRSSVSNCIIAISIAALTGVSGCSTMLHPSNLVVIKRAQTHMGTLVTITAVAENERIAQAAANSAFAEIHRLEELLSTWIPTSELSRVNAAAGSAAIPVSPETLEIVQDSLLAAELTDGGFNIAIGPAVEAWSVTERQHVPTEVELQQLIPLVDLHGIHVDISKQTVSLDRAGMRIDIGGIGKGYAADRAVEVMRKAGAAAGVVALSGDLKAFGQLPDGHGFPVGIQHPRNEGAVLAWIDLQDEAISTAGDYERSFERNGVRYHHILDPRTLQPARGCQSVTVIAREGVWADGLDTGIFVMGPERGMELVEHLVDVEAIIVDAGGRMLVSSGLRNRIRLP